MFSFCRVSGAAFPSPTAAEMAEISRIQYEMEYTEGISQRMRVPEKLKVAPANADLEQGFQEGVPNAGVIMQVPERIVVTGISHLIKSAPNKSFLFLWTFRFFKILRKVFLQVLQMYVSPAVLLQTIVISEDFLFTFSIIPNLQLSAAIISFLYLDSRFVLESPVNGDIQYILLYLVSFAKSNFLLFFFFSSTVGLWS